MSGRKVWDSFRYGALIGSAKQDDGQLGLTGLGRLGIPSMILQSKFTKTQPVTEKTHHEEAGLGFVKCLRSGSF